MHEVHRERFAKYGPIYREEALMRNPLIHISDPDDFSEVLRHQGKYPIRPPMEFMSKYRRENPERYVDAGLVNMSGEKWLQQRQNLAPVLLNTANFVGFQSLLNSICDDFCDTLLEKQSETGRIEDLHRLIYLFTQETLFALCCDRRINCFDSVETKKAQQISETIRDMFGAFQELTCGLPLWKRFSTKAYRRYINCEKFIYDQLIEDITDGFKKAKLDKDKAILLTALIRTGQYTDKEICLLLLDFIIGGMNTISTTLTLTIHNVAKFKQVQQQLQSDLCKILGTKTEIDYEDLGKFSLLKACVKETLRMNSIIPSLLRLLPNKIVLSGYEIPPYTPILINFDVPCKDEKYFNEPLKFKPERWMAESRRKINPFTLVPFGLGNRSCIGRRISENILNTAVGKFFIRFNFETFNQEIIPLKQNFVLIPGEPIRVQVKEKSNNEFDQISMETPI